LDQVTKLGPLEQLLDMLPGMSQLKQMGPIEIDPKRMAHMRAMLSSMTVEERRHPESIKGSRRRRIALGSGTPVQDVNLLLKQFEQMRTMMSQFSGMGKAGKAGKFKLPFGL
jgi:signal recognition particle subunit SRP54